MHKGRKFLIALVAMLVMTFASCATKEPKIQPETPPEPTTTTTVQVPAQPEQTGSGSQPVTTPVAVEQPSVSETELRNLFGQANSLKIEAEAYEINRVLPEDFAKADAEFKAASADYDTVVNQPLYNGVTAFPVKDKLEKSAASWEALLAEGMPLRADEESEKAAGFKLAAISAGARETAADRYEGAESLLADADALNENGSYSMAIPAYTQAAAAYDVAAEKAKANQLRSKISDNDYAKYAESSFVMAEDKYNAEESLWEAGSLNDLKAGAASLRDANASYEFVISSGAEYRALEGKDMALAAQARALDAGADKNAPEEFASATDIMNEALANQAAGNHESAYLWYVDAAEAYDSSSEASESLKAEAATALATAKTAVAATEEKSAKTGIEDKVYLPEAQYFLARAEIQNDNKLYADATVSANEATNYAGLSNTYLDSEYAKQQEAAKAGAETAIASAREAVAASESKAADAGVEDKVYLPEAQYNLARAEIQNDNHLYTDATTSANEAINYAGMSERYVDGKIAEQVAADKAVADAAMGDAKTRMAWAENNELSKDNPAEYKEASAAMEGAELAYANERYAPATDLAGEVSSILSDDFQKQVLADREAAAANAVAKAEADVAMGDAKTRMAWAENNELSKDYPAEYKEASAAMEGAELAYANERYAPAADLAGEVSSILSDDFQKQVLADREAAAANAVAKAEADVAMGDAKTRMAWAENNELSKDYPAEYKEASAAMEGAELAYANERYAPAADLAGEVSSILSDDFQKQVLADREAATANAVAKAEADAAMGDAKTRMAWAENNEISKDYPAEYKEASAAMEGAELAYANERYAPAADLAGEVSSILSDDFMNKVLASRTPEAVQAAKEEAKKIEEAKQAAVVNDAAKDGAFAEIDNAQARYDWAKANNAENNYKDLFTKGGDDLAKSKQAYGEGKFVDASALAKEAMKSLSNIKAFAPLPAVYIVRLIPERRDCLWRIAEYPFIYNNPLKWPVLYEANKKTFRDPSNPDLIFPNQVLNIPAIKGESRSGTWDPKKTYNPLPKK